jgi:hypothetical protein
MIRIRFDNASDRKLIASLKAKAPQLIQVLTSKLTALMAQLQRYIVTQKLSGQVLKRRTGILAGSVTLIPIKVQGNRILGGIDAAAGPAFYGNVHEYGGEKEYPITAVKARALAFMVDGKKVFAKSVRHPALMARPFMSTSLAEQSAAIQEQLQAALISEVNK